LFLLDTGAPWASLDEPLAKGLGVPVTGKPDEFVKIDSLVVASAALRGVKADIEPLSEMFPDPGADSNHTLSVSYLIYFQ
jgi:hypothetical protein